MKRRLMVLFLSLSAATVFAAGQKEKNAAPCGGFFLFSSGRAPLRGAGLSAAIRGLPRLPPRQSCPLCPAPPFRRPLISAPIPRAFGGSDGRLRVCRLQRLILTSAAAAAVCGSAAFNAVFWAFSCNLCSRLGRRQTFVCQ